MGALDSTPQMELAKERATLRTDAPSPNIEADPESVDCSDVDFSALDRAFIDNRAAEETHHARFAPMVVRAADADPEGAPAGAQAQPLFQPELVLPDDGTPVRLATLTTRMLVPVLVTIIIAEAGVIGFLATRGARAGSAAAASVGTLRLETTPANAKVHVDGADRGVTPLELSLVPGAHDVNVSLDSLRRAIPIQIAPGATVAYHLDLTAAPVPKATGAVLHVRSDPAGASVVVAGRTRGKTPLIVEDLPPGVHEVLLTIGTQKLRETVTVASGAETHLRSVFRETRPRPASGWIAISSPIELTIVENGQVIGTTGSPRVMVPAGRRSLLLANDSLGFRTTREVDVAAERTHAFSIQPPLGTVNINAMPWAEVWFGERQLGQTPLGNVPLPLGTQQLLFKHPTLGERRQAVTVAAGTVNRIGVDMSQR